MGIVVCRFRNIMTSQDDESGCGGGGTVTVDGAESIGTCGRMKMDDQTIRYLLVFYRIPYLRANLYYSTTDTTFHLK